MKIVNFFLGVKAPPVRSATAESSRYRTIINLCAIVWFLVCVVLFFSALALVILSAIGLNNPEQTLPHDPNAKETLIYGLKLGAVCGLCNFAVFLFGRRYFKYAYARLNDLESHELRGP